MRLTYPKGMDTSIEESNYKYQVGYWLEEVGRMVKTLKFMGKINFPAKKIDPFVSGYLDARESHFAVLKIQYWAFVIFKITVTAALLIAGCFLVIEQKLNIGQFIASEIVIITLLSSVEKIIVSLDVVYDMLTSLEKASKILDKPEEKEGILSLLDLKESNGISIKAESLSYSYNENEKLVLKNLNFEIKHGEKVCIFGSEGSGKTSLLKLFTGAYPHYNGNLLFNNYPLRNFNLQKLREEIGVYLASSDLFSGSLYENLTLGDITISTQHILNTSHETGLLPFLQLLKDGLDTPIDSIGKKLPRNTVNKILITRALLTDPKLLLIEDCWSGLEMAEQERMINCLTNRKQPFTLIGVTNDANFAAKCDKIILLEDGEILLQGTYTEVSNTEAYKKLFKQLSL